MHRSVLFSLGVWVTHPSVPLMHERSRSLTEQHVTVRFLASEPEGQRPQLPIITEAFLSPEQ
eukprot:5592966-Amphidinium_carterae.1